jgi:hypothetical protein
VRFFIHINSSVSEIPTSRSTGLCGNDKSSPIRTGSFCEENGDLAPQLVFGLVLVITVYANYVVQSRAQTRRLVARDNDEDNGIRISF